MMENLPIALSDVEDLFFSCSLKGYVGSTEKATNLEFPGSKIYRFVSYRLTYADTYFVGEDGKSFGFTIIWFDGRPIWFMQYYGFLSKANPEVADFLKDRLRETYAKKVFLGGRGISKRDSNLSYYNNQNKPLGSFAEFCGFDEVIDVSKPSTDRIILYRHDYQGGLLVPLTIFRQ